MGSTVQQLMRAPNFSCFTAFFRYENSQISIKSALKQFGDIKDIRHQTHVGQQGIYTGTRLIRMVRKHHIPSHIKIGRYPCGISGTRISQLFVIFVLVLTRPLETNAADVTSLVILFVITKIRLKAVRNEARCRGGC